MQSMRNCIPKKVNKLPLRRNNVGKFKKRNHHTSWWSEVPMAPPDSIFGMVAVFLEDKHPNKQNLTVGAYRDDNGNPYVLPSVRKAEEKMKSGYPSEEEELGIGSEEFRSKSFEFAFGPCNEIAENGLNATVQTLSGTGALSLVAKYIKVHFPQAKAIYLPQPTWGNHAGIFRHAGLDIQYYKYFDYKTFRVDFKGMFEAFCSIPDGSVVLFHASAHNPTGVDPTKEEWMEISELVKQKKFFPVFDMAYQGFASENPDDDAFPVRHFAKVGIKLALAQSFSKNLGLYGERIGTLTVLAGSREERDRILSQLQFIIRTTYANPPVYGARIVTTVLSDPQLRSQCLQEMKGMVRRIVSVRKTLRDNLAKEGSKRNWDPIVKQIGMFSYTGLTPAQVDKMINDHHVYMTRDGRMSIAGVCSQNVEYVARALHQVTK
ncbi:aspartate aminotransferase, mitochondrial [Leptinotarsa decemlineata]|uniref:aspartate aminotransferase, mitochondrial n=1 Tax=Leptinotarsa decemlineata TaxID=7539 RepID=UPI003D305A51